MQASRSLVQPIGCFWKGTEEEAVQQAGFCFRTAFVRDEFGLRKWKDLEGDLSTSEWFPPPVDEARSKLEEPVTTTVTSGKLFTKSLRRSPMSGVHWASLMKMSR